jgi:hypothetical protein
LKWNAFLAESWGRFRCHGSVRVVVFLHEVSGKQVSQLAAILDSRYKRACELTSLAQVIDEALRAGKAIGIS